MVKVSQLQLRLHFLVKLWTVLNKQRRLDWNFLVYRKGKHWLVMHSAGFLNIYILIC